MIAGASLLAGILPFVATNGELRHLGQAAALLLPAFAPFFFSERTIGFAGAAFSLGLILLGSMAGLSVIEPVALRRALLARNLQMAAAGAVAGILALGIVRLAEVVEAARDRSDES